MPDPKDPAAPAPLTIPEFRIQTPYGRPTPAPRPGFALPPGWQSPAVPFWRRVAEFAGIDDDIDAVSAAAGIARHWIQAQLPPPTPEGQARLAEVTRQLAEVSGAQAGDRQSAWDAVAGLVGSPPVQAFGRQLKEHYATPPPEVAYMADLGRQAVTAQSDAARAALPQADPVRVHGSGPLRGLSADLNPMKLLDWGVAAEQDWLPNLLLSQAADVSTTAGAALNLDLPVGAALKGAGGAAAHLAGVLPPGFYSRVDDLLKQVGKDGITPARLHKLLHADAGLADEAAFRGLDALIESRGGAATTHARTISKAELEAHLGAHPPPQIQRTVLGEPRAPMSYEEWKRHWRDAGVDEETLRRGYEDHREQVLRSGMAEQPTKYNQYTLPGGERYRESLTQLPTQMAKQGRHKVTIYDLDESGVRRSVRHISEDVGPEEVARLRQLYEQPGLPYAVESADMATPVGEPYRTPHFNQEPNVLVHTRSNERELPPRPSVDPRLRAAFDFTPEAERPAWLRESAERAGPLARGRFLEEVQSDWFQTGKKQGYRPADIHQQYREAQRAAQDARDAWVRHADEFRANYVDPGGDAPPTYEQWLEAEIIPEWQGIQHDAENRAVYEADISQGRYASRAHSRREDAVIADPAYVQLQAASRAAQRRVDDLKTQASSGVPDAPFKESWPDLALKQQLLDVAGRRDLSWLGFTSGKTQAERYNLGHTLSRLEYDPQQERLLGYGVGDSPGIVFDETVSLDELDNYIGREPAEAMRKQVAAHQQTRAYERSQWSVEPHPDSPNYGLVIRDSNGELLHDWAGDLERYGTEDRASARIDELLNDEQMNYGRELPTLAGLDLQVGGEGMRSFYDQKLPARLQKLLTPFGGTVERGAVPIQKTTHERVPGFTVVDNFGHSRGWWATREEADAYIANPPPQMASYVSAAGGAHIVPNEGVREVLGTVDEPAWIARLTPEQKERMQREGFPLMSALPPALIGGAAGAAASQSGDEQDPNAGLLAAAMAGIPFFPIKLPRAAGSLANALKRGESGMHPLRASAAERVARLTDFAETFPRQSNWRGINDPAYVRAFGGDVDEARRHLRAFAASSPATGVPDNAREAAALQAWRLLHPGQDITPAETRALPGQAMGNAGSKWQNVNDAWNDRVMGRSKYNDALKVESFGNFLQDQFGRVGHPMQRRSRPSDISWPSDRGTPLISLPQDMHFLYGAGGQPQELLDDEWAPLRQRLSPWEGLVHPETGLPLAGNQGGFTNKDLYDRTTWSLADTLANQRPGMPLQQSFGRFWTGAQANKLLEQGKKVPFAGGALDIYGNVGLLEPGAMLDPDAIYRALEKRRDWYNLGWGPGS